MLALAQQGADLRTIKVQEIATAAGVGKGTLYEYFQSKNDILAHTLVWCMQQELTTMEQALQKSESFESKMQALQGCLADIMRQRGTVYRLVFSAAEGADIHSYKSLAFPQWQRALDLRSRVVKQGRKEGKISPANSDAYCEYVISTAMLSLMGPMEACGNLEERAGFMLRMALQALA